MHDNSQLRLEGETIYLSPIQPADATDTYVHWLNIPEVNQFLESRFIVHTKESVRAYIEKVIKDPAVYLFAIVKKDTNEHIGNIKLGPIDPHHSVGSIGIMIGDQNSWGRGFATQAIRLLVEYAFGTLHLHKVTAGAYENNIGSIKAFLKLGFFEEGRKKQHVRFRDSYIDELLFGKLNPDLT
ncbi:MAG: Acetyltransferase [Parcubacteria group bacterium GW2011_GWC2_45_7]|nr:MAG: Acetyltransferase [Parcubacteria group bacterium GW2011_GWC2_45_7]KKU74145.1 MAG: Acetyltransferase [Parcubacteria group bacterium GW2011_GWA2_47_26]